MWLILLTSLSFASDNLIKDDVQIRLSLRFPTGEDVGEPEESDNPAAAADTPEG